MFNWLLIQEYFSYNYHWESKEMYVDWMSNVAYGPHESQ